MCRTSIGFEAFRVSALSARQQDVLHDLVPVKDFHPQRLPHILSFSDTRNSRPRGLDEFSMYNVVTMLINNDYINILT